MTTQELREAAQQLVDDMMYLTDKSGGVRVRVPENWQRLGEAFLRENPEDDDTPVDEAWLRSVGFCPDGAHLALCGFGPDRNGTIQFYDLDERYLCGTKMRPQKTRGDVRRLCAALGVELK